MRVAAGERLVGLDLLRGLAVAGMIVVTSPGDWAHAYPQLQHAEWNGATAADMVFPAFLFAVGMALGLSFPRTWNSTERHRFWVRVGRRVGLLIVLGLALEATYNLTIALGALNFGSASLSHLRLPGILQRIALCYGLTATLIVVTRRADAAGRADVNGRALGIAIAIILLGYWALLAFVPVPGHGPGALDPAGNLPGFIDRAVFTPPHLWWLGWAVPGGPPVYDPEGLLSTLPAATDTLFGVLAALVWRRQPARALVIITAAGLGLVAAGLLLDPVFVINKRIWTSSFALLSSGVAALFLVTLTLAARHPLVLRLLAPFRVLGGNAITAFAISTLFGRVYTFPLIPTVDKAISPQAWMQGEVLSVLGDPKLASLTCALAVLVLIILLIAPLHRRGLHLRV